MKLSLLFRTRRIQNAVDPEVLLRQLQAEESARVEVAGAVLTLNEENGWADAPPLKSDVVTLLLPGLPDDDGVPEWNEHEVPYAAGQNLDAYLAAIGLERESVSHVVIDGATIHARDEFVVELPQSRLARLLRKTFRRPAPTEKLKAFEAFIPREGAVISILPVVANNSSQWLGIIGAIVAVAAAPYTGGASLGYYFMAGAQAAFIGYAIGSAIGTLLTKPRNLNNTDDGPTSYMFGGMRNEDHAGTPVEILLGERLVAGGRISGFRRRSEYVPPSQGVPEGDVLDRGEDPRYTPQAPYKASEKLFVLVRVAGHETEGPVGVSDPNAPANLTTNLPDIRIAGQHYSNYPGVQVEWRAGAAGQSVIPGFDVVANTFDVSVDVTALGASVPFTYTTVSNQVDAFEVLLVMPGLSHTTSKGLSNNLTRYSLEYRRNGTGDPWTNADSATSGHNDVTAATRTQKLVTRRIQSLPRAKYDIRITWISATHTDVSTDQWHVFVSSITEETQGSRNYEGDSLVAIKGLASEQFNGSIDSLVVTAMWRGAKPQKWTSGGGFAAADWGVGSATPAGRNRGWLGLWLLRNQRLGCGNELPDAGIRLDQWKAYADACDTIETVTPVDEDGNPAGSPYTEPRHQLDLYVNQQQAAIDLLTQILASARGAVILSGNKAGVGYNGTASVRQRFGMGNIKERSLKLQYHSQRNEINTYDVVFEDRAADFDTDTATVCIKSDGTFCTEAQLQVAGETVKRRQLQLTGVTRRTEGVREGRFALKQIFAIRTLGSFGSSSDSIFAETFDVIELAHDLTQWGYSGHVHTAADASHITIERNAPFGGSYSLMVRFAGGDSGADYFEDRAVSAVAASGRYWVITLSTPFSRVPQEGDLWFYGPTTTKLKPFRIMEISLDADCQREISIIEYNASIANTTAPIEIPTYSLLPNFAAPPAPITAAVSFIETKTSSNNASVIKQVIIQATPPASNDPKYGFAKGMRVEYAFTSTGPWVGLQSVDGFEYRWADAPHGVDLYFRVTPYSTVGKYNYDGAFVITTPANIADNWARSITPQNPTSVTFSPNPTAQRRRAVTSVPGQPAATTQIFSLFLSWSFADSVNPTGSLIGFFVEIYQSGGDPDAPYLSAMIADPAARSWPISDITFEASATWVGAVQAVYVDAIKSALVTSSGLFINPSTSDDVLAQLKTDVNGGYYLDKTTKLTAADGSIIIIDKNGVWTTSADGIQRAPRRVSHSLLRAATSGQFVPWTDPSLDPPLMPNVFGTAASKLHVVTQLRAGPTIDMQPTNYPPRIICEATEMSAQGFRLSLSQCDGGVSQVLRATSDNDGNWTVNGASDGAANATHGSPMLLTAIQNPTDTNGKAAWYDPLNVSNAWPIVIRDVIYFAADMPTVKKPDGTFYYVDLKFGIHRVAGHLSWNGSYSSMPAGSYNLWDAGILRAYTNGKRWRMPWTAMFQSGVGQSFLMWWMLATYETGTTSSASAPIRVLIDAFESHGVLSSVATPASWRGSFGNESVDILLAEDN